MYLGALRRAAFSAAAALPLLFPSAVVVTLTLARALLSRELAAAAASLDVLVYRCAS